MEEELWRDILIDSLRKGLQIKDAIDAANAALEAYKKAFPPQT